jgi:hypothetical protein
MLVLSCAWPTLAQRPQAGNPPVQASSAEDRARELRAVVGLVTTPDRNLNIANFEEIVDTGDVRRIELAVRTLVESEDAVLRGMAMRAYVGAVRDMVFDVELPPAAMRIVEQARDAPGGFRNVAAPHRYLAYLAAVQFTINMAFEPAPLRELRGRVTVTGYQPVDYVVRGDRVTFRSGTIFSGVGLVLCNFELRPGRAASIAATMTCENADFSRPISLVAPMF